MISSQQLGERIAEARKNARLTQAQVAERVGFARTTLVAIEKGERRPSNPELVRIAEQIGVPLHELLREHHVKADISPRFRMLAGTSKEVVSVTDAVERLRTFGRRYAELERLNEVGRIVPRLEALQTYKADQSGSLDPRLLGQDAATTLRGLFGMGEEPALDLDQRFEIEAGLRITYLERVPYKMSAVFIWGDEIGACVGINLAHPLERRRWSLVHELGHFLRDRDAGDVLDEGQGKDPGEVFSDSFAVAFLMPANGVSRRFADRCRANGNRFTAMDIYTLAQQYQVSFETMTRRLEELRLLPKGTWDRLNASRIRPRDLVQEESKPAASPPSRFPRRYVELAVRAFDRELISEGELAEFLDTDRIGAREIYQEHESVLLDDGRELSAESNGEDLRNG